MSKLMNSSTNIEKTVGRHAATLGKRYGQIKEGLNTLDGHVNTAKQVYNDPAVQSTIKDLTGDKVTSRVNKSLSNYDQIRNRVVSTHNEAGRHTNNVVGGLCRSGVSIGICSTTKKKQYHSKTNIF